LTKEVQRFSLLRHSIWKVIQMKSKTSRKILVMLINNHMLIINLAMMISTRMIPSLILRKLLSKVLTPS